MQQLSIGGVVGCHDSSWSSTSSSVVSGSGGGGDCPARRVVGAMTTRPTFRSTSRPWGVNNDASSTTALLSSSPGKSLGLLSASFAFETTVSSGDNGPVAGDFVPSSLSSLGERPQRRLDVNDALRVRHPPADPQEATPLR
ncbi:hypothetical protein ACHAXA_003943 [Cyclostephanos tholiformis]|uniref:Uncharacterized protein n=1 Tax=Cyclostephanos tholiformis TaxID=382380 RepID=A0ABD3RYL8_9STRA